jgi:hypothetical protein
MMLANLIVVTLSMAHFIRVIVHDLAWVLDSWADDAGLEFSVLTLIAAGFTETLHSSIVHLSWVIANNLFAESRTMTTVDLDPLIAVDQSFAHLT